MSQHPHEELEVGHHLDQTVRTALTGVAQLIERISRSSAERDREAAQAIREHLLHERLAAAAPRPSPGTDPGLAATTRPDPTLDIAPALAPGPGRDDGLEGLRGQAGTYYTSAAGEGAGRTAAAWSAAVRDLAADPGHPTAGSAAASLNEHSRRRYGIDLASTIANVVSDAQAHRAAAVTESAAAAAAARETAVIMLPANRANPDRGVSPTKAATAEEASHRRQTWELTRAGWERDNSATYGGDPRQLRAEWGALPTQTKTDLYWKQYDTEPARTVPTAATPGGTPAVGPSASPAERGLQPSKAPNAEERAHREEAWRMAQTAHTATLPEGTKERDARRSWEALEWQDKALRYWTAYDDPASRAVTAGAPAVTAAAGGEITRARVVQLNEQAADYFATQAGPGSKGRAYLENRLGAEVVDHGPWRLGYAPTGWTKLTDHLRHGGATNDEILAAGLGRVSSRGTVIDAFRDRATVGIHGDQGEIIGFVGRDLSGGDTAPKYVNTGGTAAYTKGDHLLGLHEAEEGARLVRVEGPFDAIAVTAAGGGRYAGVAPLGTALTSAQADTLAARSGGRVWHALDGDAAGNRATEDDFWLMRDRGVDARLIPLPGGTDPAQLWREDPDRLRTLLDVAEAAPTAGLVVVDNAVQELRPALRDGEATAFEELAAVQDKIAAALPGEQDRVQVDAYAAATVQGLRAQADDEQVVSHRLDAADDVADAAAEKTTSPSKAEDLEATAERARSGREELANHADDLDATATHAATVPAYNRAAAVSQSAGDSEAATARVASAAGFSRPTRDMLADAQNRSGTPARPGASPAPNLGRARGQRR